MHLLLSSISFFMTLFLPSAANAFSLPGETDIVEMMNNVITDISGIFASRGLYVAVCFIAGVCIFAAGLVRWTKVSTGGVTPGSAIMRMAGGVLLVSIGFVLNTTAQTFFADSGASIISQGASGGGMKGAVGATFRFCIFIVQIVGFLAVAKAMLIFPYLADGNNGGRGTASEFFVYLIAGIICVNILKFLLILATTLGGPAPGYLQEIMGYAGL